MGRLRQMIKQAVLNLIDDSGPYPRGQANYNGKTTDFLQYSPYGLESSPPPNSWVLLLSSQSQESVKIGLIADFLGRKKNKLPGEVRLHNTLTGSNILLKADGSIEIEAATNLNATVVGNANITAANLTATIVTNAFVTAGGNITLTATGTVNLISTGDVNLGGLGGAGVARIGDSVAGGVITGGSSKVKAVA